MPQAVIAWNPKGMWSLKFGNAINPYWISNPERLRVIAQGIVTAAESGSHSDATEPVDSPVAKGDVPKPH